MNAPRGQAACICYTVRMPGIRKTFLRATLTLTGTIIGAGIFGVPSVMHDVGLFAGTIIFWGTWLVVLTTHLLFLELIACTDGKDKRGGNGDRRHRLPGYVGGSLGRWAKYLSATVQSLQLVGASFAYVILGGEFLSFLLAGFGVSAHLFTLEIVFWAVGAVAILLALQLMAKIESAFTWALLAVLAILIGAAALRVDPSELLVMHWERGFLPVGVFLFALFGMTIIPELFEITGRRTARTRHAIIAGSFTAAILTWLFGVTLAAAVPEGVALDRASMVAILPPSIWWILPLVGLFAVLTSFITTAFALKMMYRIELNRPPWTARFVALGIPFILLFVAARDFLKTVDTVGTFFTGGLAVMVTLAAYGAMQRRNADYPFWWRTVAPLASAGFFITIMLSRLIG